MVVNPNSFDSGIFLSMLAIGFACLTLYQKIGAVLLAVSVLCFLVSGLLILTGYDVSSFSQTVTTSGTINHTSYFIGNGSFPETGTGQLWYGWSLTVLAIVVAVVFLDQTIKGNLIRGD